MDPNTSRQEKLLFSFDEPRGGRLWRPVGDAAWGGRSRPHYAVSDDGTALFCGVLSLENDGGLVAMRSRHLDLGLEGFDEIVLRVRGDGRTYALCARRSDLTGEPGTWRLPFETVPDAWITVALPLARLRRFHDGVEVPGAPPPRAAEIHALSILLADGRPGPFSLEIESIRARAR